MEKKFVAQFLALTSAMLISDKAFKAVTRRVVEKKHTFELESFERWYAPIQWMRGEDGTWSHKGDSYGAGKAAQDSIQFGNLEVDTTPSVSKAEATLLYWRERLSKTVEMLKSADVAALQAEDTFKGASRRPKNGDEEVMFCKKIKVEAQAEIERLRGEWRNARTADGKKYIEELAAAQNAIIRNSDNRIARRMAKLEKQIDKKLSWVEEMQEQISYIQERIEAAEANMMNEDDIAAGICSGEEFSLVTEDGPVANWDHWKYAAAEGEAILETLRNQMAHALLTQAQLLDKIEELIAQRKQSGYSVHIVRKVNKFGDETMSAVYRDGNGGWAKLNYNPNTKVAFGLVDGRLVEVEVPNGKSFRTAKLGKFTTYTFAQLMIELIRFVDFSDMVLVDDAKATLLCNRYEKYSFDLSKKLEERQVRAEEKEATEIDAQDKASMADVVGRISTMSLEASIDWKRQVERTAASLMKGMKMSREEALCASILQHEANMEQDDAPFRNFKSFDETVEGFFQHINLG